MTHSTYAVGSCAPPCVMSSWLVPSAVGRGVREGAALSRTSEHWWTWPAICLELILLFIFINLPEVGGIQINKWVIAKLSHKVCLDVSNLKHDGEIGRHGKTERWRDEEMERGTETWRKRWRGRQREGGRWRDRHTVEQEKLMQRKGELEKDGDRKGEREKEIEQDWQATRRHYGIIW